MKAIRDSLIIAWIKFYPVRRQPLSLIFFGIILNTFPLFFMWVFGQEGLLSHGLVGALVTAVGLVGAISGIQDMTWDRYVKIREMIVAMPVHPLSYALGIALGALLFSIPGLLVFMAVGVWWGMFDLIAIVWTLAALFLCWASLSTMGFMIATYLVKVHPYTLNNISMVFGFVLAFILPVYYPAELLGSFGWISLLVPTSAAASVIRTYLGLSTPSYGGVASYWLALIFSTIFFAVLASAKARWREV